MSLEIQHKLCQQDAKSWCKFAQDKLKGTNQYSEATRLPSVFLDHLKPVFDRLTDIELLSKCQLGLTQNSNESCHNVLWSKCSKTIFCGKERLLLAVGETVGTFNTGAGSKKALLRAAGIENVGLNTLRMLQREDEIRKKSTSQKISKKYKLYRIKKKTMKKKAVKGTRKDYEAGGFDNQGKTWKAISTNKRKWKAISTNKSAEASRRKQRKRISPQNVQCSSEENTEITMPIPLKMIKPL